jgi:hypothetical protein
MFSQLEENPAITLSHTHKYTNFKSEKYPELTYNAVMYRYSMKL